jgi:hypothetical protein
VASLSKDPEELSARYTTMYHRIQREAGANCRGTYFGRLVHYPARDKPVNQLTRLIEQLRRGQNAKHTRPVPIYETTTSTAAAVPAQDRQPPDDTDETLLAAAVDAIRVRYTDSMAGATIRITNNTLLVKRKLSPIARTRPIRISIRFALDADVRA